MLFETRSVVNFIRFHFYHNENHEDHTSSHFMNEIAHTNVLNCFNDKENGHRREWYNNGRCDFITIQHTRCVYSTVKIY